MKRVLNYSPFEPTKVSFFESFENLINYNQYFTSNIVSLFCITIVVVLYIVFFNTHQINSILFYYLSFLYIFIYNIVYEYLNKKVNYYFAFLFYIFLFILFGNLVGLLSFAFIITSHLTNTLICAMFMWLTVITLGFANNDLLFFKIVLPKGIPYVLVPFLICIEIISYIFRVISLALRLFANILAGHILLHVVSSFIFLVLAGSITGFSLVTIIIGISLISVLCVLFFFELVVACLQSYIFIVLSLIYLQDVYNLSH